MQQQSTRDQNLVGASWMVISMLGYVVNDAFIKKAVEEAPLFEAILVRGVMIVVLLTAVVFVRGEQDQFRRLSDSHLLARVGLEAGATALYLSALRELPLANVTAALQLVPLMVTFAAARLLRERVDWVRVATLIAGLIGVGLVVRPGTGAWSPWYLVVLGAMLVVVVRELLTARISAEVPTSVVAWSTAMAITLMGAVGTAASGWPAPSGTSVMLLGCAALALSVGYTASINAVRFGELSFTASFRYTVLVFAVALQIAVFGEIPDLLTIVGACVVAGAGLFSFARERGVTATVPRG